MIGFNIFRWPLLVLLFIVPAQGQMQSSAAPQESSGCQTARPLAPIPADAEQVANEIGIVPLVEHLRAIVSALQIKPAPSRSRN